MASLSNSSFLSYLLFNQITLPSHCRFLFSLLFIDLYGLIYLCIYTVAFSLILKLHSLASSILWIEGFAIETIEYRNKSYYLTESTNTWISYPSELNKWLEDQKLFHAFNGQVRFSSVCYFLDKAFKGQMKVWLHNFCITSLLKLFSVALMEVGRRQLSG
jgi:hypothetical protein